MTAFVSVRAADGEIITGLAPGLFMTRVNSEELKGKQSIYPFSMKTEPIDYSILISNNGIMEGEPLDYQKLEKYKMRTIPYITLSAELFEKCLPWRDGKYITIDKRGCFATVEWEKIFGKDILTTKPICNFPKQDCTPGYFSASPKPAGYGLGTI